MRNKNHLRIVEIVDAIELALSPNSRFFASGPGNVPAGVFRGADVPSLSSDDFFLLPRQHAAALIVEGRGARSRPIEGRRSGRRRRRRIIAHGWNQKGQWPEWRVTLGENTRDSIGPECRSFLFYCCFLLQDATFSDVILVHAIDGNLVLFHSIKILFVLVYRHREDGFNSCIKVSTRSVPLFFFLHMSFSLCFSWRG